MEGGRDYMNSGFAGAKLEVTLRGGLNTGACI